MKARFFIFFTLLSASFFAMAQEEYVAVSIAEFDTISDQPGDRLGLSVSESLNEALGLLSGIKLYERTQLERITAELQLGISSAELFEQSSIQQVGNLVSIDYFILGSVTRVEEQLRIALRLTEIRSGAVILSTRLEGAYGDLFDMEDELAYQVIHALDVNMSDLERRRMEERRPPDPEAFEVYNQALGEGDLLQRRALLEEARRKDPGYAIITQCLADTYLELGQGPQAAFLYRELLTQDPQNYSAQYNLSILLFDQNRISQAKAAFQRCLELRPDDTDALYNLALLHEMGTDGQRLGPGAELEKAVELYKGVIALSPNYPNALYALGIIHIMWAQGVTDGELQEEYIQQSIYYLERYLEVLPQAFNAQEVRENLQMFHGISEQFQG